MSSGFGGNKEGCLRLQAGSLVDIFAASMRQAPGKVACTLPGAVPA